MTAVARRRWLAVPPVLGWLAVVSCTVAGVGLVLGLGAIVSGHRGLSRSRAERDAVVASYAGMGLVCGYVAASIGLAVLVVLIGTRYFGWFPHTLGVNLMGPQT